MEFPSSQLPEGAVRTDEISGVWSFLWQVDWSEPFLQLVVMFHCTSLVTVWLLRTRPYTQATLFSLLLASVALTEPINTWLAANHTKVARLQYWDRYYIYMCDLPRILLSTVISPARLPFGVVAKVVTFCSEFPCSSGLFISLTWSAPVLLNCTLVLLSWFWYSGDLLVRVKRRQLQQAEITAKETKKDK